MPSVYEVFELIFLHFFAGMRMVEMMMFCAQTTLPYISNSCWSCLCYVCICKMHDYACCQMAPRQLPVRLMLLLLLLLLLYLQYQTVLQALDRSKTYLIYTTRQVWLGDTLTVCFSAWQIL